MRAILKKNDQVSLQECFSCIKNEENPMPFMPVLKNLFFILLFLYVTQISSFSYADENVKVKDISYTSTPQSASVFIEISDIPKIVHYRLSNPERIIVDLKNATVMDDVDPQADIEEDGGMVKSISTDQYSNKVRVVVALANGDSDYQVALLKRPLRIGIEVSQKKEKELEADEKTVELSAQKAVENVALERDKAEITTPYQADKNEDIEKIAASDIKRSKEDTQKNADKERRSEKTLSLVAESTDDNGPDIRISRETTRVNIAEPPPSFTSMDFQEYVKKVLDANPAVKINEQDYKEMQLKSLRDLQTYGFQLALNGGASAAVEKMGTGANIRLDLTKNLYDGGKKQILEREFEVVKALSRANLIESYDTVILTAVLYYTDFYYKQEVLDFLKQQFELQRIFIDRVQHSYQKGIKFSSYDFLTSQADHLKLENSLVSQKADMSKTDLAFRQFGHIYNEGPIKLSPLDVTFTTDMQRLQKYALVYNKSIYSARLRNDLQKYKINEREAEGGLRLNAGSSLGFQAGTGDYTGGTNLIARVFLDFSLPLFDSGVRKTEILTEQVGYLKQRLTVQKTEEEVIKSINDIYIDYKTIGSSLENLDEQLNLNEKRLRISMERLEKGLDDYRAVRESWNDLIDTKIELIRNKTLEQKLLVDLLILSGMNLFR